MNQQTESYGNFNPLPLIIVVLLLSFGISLWANWYSDNISLPRYCGQEQETLVYLKKIIQSDRPAGDEARRPYLIAAKLLFIVPRQGDETDDQYLERVRYFLLNQCDMQ